MKAAVCVVLRKDMSLNRRLYTWLLGDGEKVDSEAYFRQHSIANLTAALQDMLDASVGEAADYMRPYKVMISLLDRAEIGGPVVDHFFYGALKSLRSHSKASLPFMLDV